MATAAVGALDKDRNGVVTEREAIDRDANGKVSKSEFVQSLDENKDGKVSRHEAVDLNSDGKVGKLEKDLVDQNDDGKVTRHEVLSIPAVVDANRDGKLTKQELTAAAQQLAALSPPLPSVHALAPSAPPPSRRPPRTSWRYGYWDHPHDAVDEFVLLVVCAVTLYQAVRWVHRRLARRRYQPIKAGASEYSMDYSMRDPGLELANVPDDGEPSVPSSAFEGGTAASAAAVRSAPPLEGKRASVDGDQVV